MKAVETYGLFKRYGAVEALRGVSFEVERGEIFGIVGPDGAGKTSLFRILTTLLLPDGGRAAVMGRDTVTEMQAIRSIAGYMPERFSLYQDMSVEENLRFFATLFYTSIEENYDLIKDIYVQIEPFRRRRAGVLSGGMKQKLALCCALIHKPEVLFLDEPTTGVDPVSRSEFWQMLARLREQQITILVSTPNMDEAAQCDRIALVRNGRFLKIDTPRGIVADFRHRLWAARSDRMHALLTDLRAHRQVRSCFAMGVAHHITVGDALTESELAAYLTAKGHGEIHLKPVEATVEDCFMLMDGDD
jgi:ABC-type multidrug transport system ATPase subunit